MIIKTVHNHGPNLKHETYQAKVSVKKNPKFKNLNYRTIFIKNENINFYKYRIYSTVPQIYVKI